MQQAARDFETPPHTSGKLFDRAVATIPEFEQFQQAFAPFHANLLRHFIKCAVQFQVFERRQFIVETGILKDDAKALADLILLVRRIETVDFDLAAGRPQQCSQHFDSGGFTRAIRSEEGKDFAHADLKRNVANRLNLAKSFREMFNPDHSAILN